MPWISLNLSLSCICLVFGIIILIASNRIIYGLKHKYNYDEISGLYTVMKFKTEAEKLLSKARPSQYAFVCIDIENFQYLTDSLGRGIANSVLSILGKNFIKCAPKGALLCRRYADNFVMLTDETFGPIIEDYVLNMVGIVSKMGNLLPLHYTLDFTTGVYIIMNPGDDIEVMIHKANLARQEGRKSMHPGRLCFFDETMLTNSEHEKEIIFDMNRAFEANEFIPYYQPKFDFMTNEIVGAEALVRWKHREKGILQPGYFIPLFEKNGFVTKIDRKIFEDVCRFLDAWNKSGKDGHCPKPLTISCNLSRYQLYNSGFAKEYATIASKYQIYPSKIEIELTESLMMDNKKRLLRAMNEIKNAGFDISIDDFGAGFSSLSLLKDIPASVLKLDKEFFANTAGENAEENPIKDNIIVNCVIDMAKKLSMKTVAEGVEEEHQAKSLKEMGCDIAQGYYYAKPMSEEDFLKLLASDK